jgi:hypothetical protein|tara:strand:- start:164 stop:373 length:210 start_codon:yes stop_codon:yes gene_type:complete
MSKKESNKQIMTKLKEETSLDVSVEEQNYLNQLTDIQKIAYSIAKEHLESSFDLEKSIGFKQWMESNKK